MLVLATKNKNKLAELQATLAEIGEELRSAFDFAQLEEVVEDADTLEGNALKKARYTFEMTQIPSISDDTGLEVEALGGRPGVFSARYAGEGASYTDNVIKLLQELHQTTGKTDGVLSKARFRTVIAYVSQDRQEVYEGICEGNIIAEPRGARGFGYDPVFVPLGYDLSFAEMDPALKNAISHRGKAVARLLKALKT